jgi:uncharacterized oligopeptide transporter (OPT) family protein
VVQTIASSIAGMPIAASLLSVIPALEFLRKPEEGDKCCFSLLELIRWSLGVSLFGTVFSAPFRTYFLLRLRLRFPGGYATGVLIGLLHNDEEVARIADLDRKNGDRRFVDNPSPEIAEVGISSDRNEQQSGFLWASTVIVMLKAFVIAAIWVSIPAAKRYSRISLLLQVLVSYFIPSLNSLPIFGVTAARSWFWFLTLSPAFIAFGMILDLSVACSMVLGAILGWGVLSPVAKNLAWAPGPIDSMETGVRGSLIWISLSSLLGDAFISLLHGAVAFALRFYSTRKPPQSQESSGIAGYEDDPSCQPLLEEPISDNDDDLETINSLLQPTQADNIVSNKAILYWSLGSTFLCVVCTYLVFRLEIPVYAIIVAVAVAFPLCFIVIQSAGETDTIPSISLSTSYLPLGPFFPGHADLLR